MDLKWRIKPWGEATLVELEGEVDLHSAPPLKEALLEIGSAQSALIALDLNGVSFLDSTGIGALVGAFKKTREGNGKIAFFGARPRVKRVFQIAGLWNALPFYESRDAALAALLPAPLVTAPDPTTAPAEGEAHVG